MTGKRGTERLIPDRYICIYESFRGLDTCNANFRALQQFEQQNKDFELNFLVKKNLHLTIIQQRLDLLQLFLFEIFSFHLDICQQMQICNHLYYCCCSPLLFDYIGISNILSGL